MVQVIFQLCFGPIRFLKWSQTRNISRFSFYFSYCWTMKSPKRSSKYRVLISGLRWQLNCSLRVSLSQLYSNSKYIKDSGQEGTKIVTYLIDKTMGGNANNIGGNLQNWNEFQNPWVILSHALSPEKEVMQTCKAEEKGIVPPSLTLLRLEDPKSLSIRTPGNQPLL